MKKILTTAIAVTMSLTAFAQPRSVVLPGRGNIDVERLNRPIDLGMDISQLSLSEVRVLRNALAARQGYCFMSADLRGLFNATSWYNSLMEDRYYAEEAVEYGELPKSKAPAPISYTAEEKDFMARLKAREDELRQHNFDEPKGLLCPLWSGVQSAIVNTDNIVNPYQLDKEEPLLMQALARNGFAIVPADHLQLFHVYERNDYHEFPSFVTTDLYLQAFHIYFDCILREAEQSRFAPTLTKLTQDLHQTLFRQTQTATQPDVKAAAQYGAAYFAVAHALFTGGNVTIDEIPDGGKASPYSRQQLLALAQKEVANATAAANDYSEFLEYTADRNMPMFGYNLFRPRGHYTRNETLQRYFRGMMWLQTVPFGTDNDGQLRRALLLAQVIGSHIDYANRYNSVAEPLTFLMGAPDNVTILQVYKELKKMGKPLGELFVSKSAMRQLRAAIEQVAKAQTRIQPKFLMTSQYKINLMPQRYMPDSEVLQEMVDYDSPETLRATPKGLDVLAAMGVGAAEQVLLLELGEQDRWSQYTPNLERMKQRMGEIDWHQTVANRWMESLTTLPLSGGNAPYFMQTGAWDKKCLNAALASWAELKHDAILYAKQPMGAECGGAGIPEPTVKGYVEPNVNYWRAAIDLIDATVAVLQKYQLMTEKIEGVTEPLRDKAQFLLNISEKELQGRTVTNEEYDQIEYIGAAFENMTLDMIREPDQWLMGWDDVQGADKNVAVVADVYTANAMNNPNKSVLYEAVGPAHEIYVVVEIDGYLWLTRGAVFSYREFGESLSMPRLTDEEWHEQLKEQPNKGIPDWMKDIIVPIDGKNLDNEYIFYSSGC